MAFSNVYDDERRAHAYATLEFPGTYNLAFRDLHDVLRTHVRGRRALDFGCGAGRSTRLLRSLGYDAVGIDIASNMVELARAADPDGDYVLVRDGDYGEFAPQSFDLVLSAFAFDNIPGADHRRDVLAGLRRLLRADGVLVLLGSRPEIYTHEWASFTTRDFPDNRNARSGDEVRIVIKDVPDARPVVDRVWFHEDYVRLFEDAGFRLVAHNRPLARGDEGIAWVSETTVPPWVVYVATKQHSRPQ